MGLEIKTESFADVLREDVPDDQNGFFAYVLSSPTGSIQGFGRTEEEAVIDALKLLFRSGTKIDRIQAARELRNRGLKVWA